MKLIIQIPAYNEEKTIAATLADIPREITGITSIETIVIDDGSRDGTVENARRAGASHVVRLLNHRGLAAAFAAGINEALKLGADVIVNTDADHQYRGEDIKRLVEPIVKGEADLVIGDRLVRNSPFMGPMKKLLQRIGSRAVALASGVPVPDATSGLRAFSREAAFQINVFNPFTYTLETIIQAGTRNLEIRSVPITTNAPLRPSRLYSGIGSYVRKSVVTLFRVYTLYKPLKTFVALGALFFAAGLAVGFRFLYFYALGDRGGHLQSLILAAILLIVGVQTALIGLVADLISVNRRLSEEVLIRLKKLDQPPSRRAKPQRPSQSATTPASEKETPSKQQPETQWVWLVDEATLDERTTAPAPARPSTSGSRRRRRKRGGMRPDQSGSRERKHHPQKPEPDASGE